MAEEEVESREEEWLRNWTPMAVDYGEYDALRAGSIDGTGTTAHDHGIVRAMSAKYRPPKDLQSDPYHTVFVGRINHDTTEDTLREIFSECGTIKSLRLVRDIATGRSKGYAFIEYEHTDEAEVAYQRCHRMSVDGYAIVVEFECGRMLPGWVPRRLGGGFGGKKESGQLRFGGRERPFRKPIVMGSRMLGSRGRRGGRGGDVGASRETRRREWEGRERERERETRDRDRERETRDRDRERSRRRDSTENWSTSRERHRSPKRDRERRSPR